ncbi:hypothetical protein DFH28DRAFT_1111753 [Melampsora americana]|nr:hypothetical protein DFH28DRAFT_1111753 [Melampsora americana]
MPTLQEIVEMVSPDQSNTDHADSEEEVERVPWSMNECRKAIDELSYAFNYRKSDDPEEPNWAPHIRYLANIMEDVNHVKRQSMKQKSITDFFRREKSPIEIQDSDSD